MPGELEFQRPFPEPRGRVTGIGGLTLPSVLPDVSTPEKIAAFTSQLSPRPLSTRKLAAATSSAPAPGITLAPTTAAARPAPASQKLAAAECRARGGELVQGRCILIKTIRAPGLAPGAQAIAQRGARVEGGSAMGIRAQLISPGFLPQAGSTPLLGGLIQGGLDILGQFLGPKFGAVSVSPTPLATGGLIPIGGSPVGLAAVTAAVVAGGGAIIGSVIRISRVAWQAIPSLVKQAAVALGLTVAFTDIGLDFPGGNGAGGLSQAQQRKIQRFQQLTGAGVPPGIAARATGIGKRRRRGISAFELSGFRKISHLLGHVGMVPRGLRAARPSRGHHHHK